MQWQHFVEDHEPLIRKLTSAEELVFHETKDPEIQRKITQI